MRRSVLAIILGFVCLACLYVAPALAGHRPELDVASIDRPSKTAAAALERARRDLGLQAIGTAASFDERYGVPSFVWGTRGSTTSGTQMRALAPAQAARVHLGRLAPYYRLSPSDVDGAVLRDVHDTGRGGIIVSFTQAVDGIDVFRDEIRILLDRDLGLLAASGYLPSKTEGARTGIRDFRIGSGAAARIALDDFAKIDAAPTPLDPMGSADGGVETSASARVAPTLPDALVPSQPLRVEKVFFHRPGSLEPAYYVEVTASEAAYSYVVSAVDGAILFRHDQVANDSFTYRVWASATPEHIPADGPQGDAPSPHPTGTPSYFNPALTAPALLSLQNGPISTNDPWLPPGATQTTGNNVDAYADLFWPDGFSAGDLRASTTSANTFDRTYDTALAPNVSANQQMAAITQLFYANNFFHDWYYDAGFDEASGNAQLSNYGRGGAEGDPLHVEAQDYSGTNNANMWTPADGSSPRMQMFLYVPAQGKLLVSAPPSLSGNRQAGTANFGPQTFSVTGNVILANDGSGNPTDGCSALVNNVSGKIVLVDRGTCSFLTKAANAEAAGAVGVIIADNVAHFNPPGLTGTPPPAVSIPVLSVTQALGDSIKTALAGGTVTVTMARAAALMRDGTIDNQIVAHEWGHYISNRLIGNANGLSTNQAGGLGEGWGDFHALLMTVRPEDAFAPSNVNFTGTYALASYAPSSTFTPSNVYYFGVRRLPYSTDFAKNALTFMHIQNGVALPVGPPTASGSDGANNAEVHRTGEVWCTMLWECFTSLLRDTGRLTFTQARDRMRDYLVASYKLTPNAPTFTEARDALLAAALAYDSTDFTLFWQAFARRGAGVGAVAPDRFSTTNIGVVESYVVGGDLALVSAVFQDDVHTCDPDGYIDGGETGRLLVTLANTGAVDLAATTMTVTSTNPAVSFPIGNSAAFAATAPFATATASLQVRLAPAAGTQTLDVQLQYEDPDIAAPKTAPVTAFGNVDETPSTHESVETHAPPWTFAGTPIGQDDWCRIAVTGIDHRFCGSDAGSITDHVLISPLLQVAPTGSFSFSFTHAHSFERDASEYYDGGVIEITQDAGASWTDIGAFATPGYTDTLSTAYGNPLAGRPAYAGTNAAYPNLETVNVYLGTAYQGRTVQVRFRLGTDMGVGDQGWQIASLSFSNLLNQPFLELTPEPDACTLAEAETRLPTAIAFALAGGNPVARAADFRFALPSAAHVQLAIYDVGGRRVATVTDGPYAAGTHLASWDFRDTGTPPANGVYLARLQVNGREFRQRVVLVR